MRSKGNSQGSRMGAVLLGETVRQRHRQREREKDIETERDWKQGGAKEERGPGQMPQDEGDRAGSASLRTGESW